MRANIGHVTLEFTTDDITRQGDLDAVVNAANAELMPGGGVAGAIHRAAGPRLAEACRPVAPIRSGEAVATDAFDLPNKRVIHCLGPVYGRDEHSHALLAACCRKALRIAENEGLLTIGFPAISTGAFGYPLEEAARIALGAVRASAPTPPDVRRVRFVFFDEHALRVHEAALGALD